MSSGQPFFSTGLRNANSEGRNVLPASAGAWLAYCDLVSGTVVALESVRRAVNNQALKTCTCMLVILKLAHQTPTLQTSFSV